MKLSGKRLVALCYAGFLAASILLSGAQMVTDAVLRAQEKLVTEHLTLADFATESIEETAPGQFVTTTDDPRMVLQSCPERVRSLEITMDFGEQHPGEVTLFYQPRPGMEEFDANYRLWAVANEDNTYTFTLPRGKVYGLRLDPAIYGGIKLTLGDITLNPEVSVLSWFVPDLPWLAAFTVIPALIASAVSYLGAVAGEARRRAAK